MPLCSTKGRARAEEDIQEEEEIIREFLSEVGFSIDKNKGGFKSFSDVGGDSELYSTEPTFRNGYLYNQTCLQHHKLSPQSIMFKTISKEPREALEDPKTSTANEAGPQMAFPRTTAHMRVPECGGASPLSVGHGGAARIDAQPLADPSPPLRPLSCACGELARSVSGTPLRRNLTPVDTGNRFYFEI